MNDTTTTTTTTTLTALTTTRQDQPVGPVGCLAKAFCSLSLPLAVLQSARGFYLGTADQDGPCTRESVQYWPSEADAKKALATGMWTQRARP